MKENIAKSVVTAAAAGIGLYCRALAVPAIVLAVVMGIDYLTGVMRARMHRQLCSKIGVLGIFKKLAYLCAVAVAIVIDWVIQHAAGRAGIDLGSFFAFGLLVMIWLILNECISILENISDIGVPLPAFLMVMIEKLKKTTEAKGEAMVAPDKAEDGHGSEKGN